jgi:hypothetical protein
MGAEKLSKSLLDETTGRLHGVDRLVLQQGIQTWPQTE